MSSIQRNTVELILSAIYRQAGDDGLMASFMFGRPGSLHWDRRLGDEIFFRRKQLIRAALYVRQNGPAYLRYISVNEIWEMLTNFVTENYWHLCNDVFGQSFNCSYAEYVSNTTKTRMAEALASSKIFMPMNLVTVFPLIPVQVKADFVSEPFFLIAPESLVSKLGDEMDKWVKADQFPPLKDWKGKIEIPSAWLGVSSPVVQASVKMRSVILGALALTPLPSYRHMFSGRRIFGGQCTINDGAKTSFGEPHTPPLMHDISVTQKDHAWLSILATKLMSNEKSVRCQLRSLEYFYRAWPLDESERFPILCMALDGVFGDANRATQSVIEGIRATIGNQIDPSRLRLLMDLRAAVIHGGAPGVYDSKKYARYYDKYDCDPISDLELVVARCLQSLIFGPAFVEQPDPNAQLIAEMQSKGRLPQFSNTTSILGSGTNKLV